MLFGATFFQVTGVLMLTPWLLLVLKEAGVSSTVAGLFAATSWLGVLLITPVASSITQALGRRRALWLSSSVPLLCVLGFYTTDHLGLWFVLELLAGVAGGLRWVLAEAFVAEFAPPAQRGRYIGIYSTILGSTFFIGPSLLTWVGTQSPYALGLIAALLAVGLLGTWGIPVHPATTPPPSTSPEDTAQAAVGWRGLWQVLREHPVVMLTGFVAGIFELGLASTLPLYGLWLGWAAGAATLLVAVSGLGGTLFALPAGLLADRFASPAQGRRHMMRYLAGLLLLAALVAWGINAGLLWAGLLWAVVCVWGAAGGALYTLTMTDIGARAQGLELVNSTAVLVLNYTLGGLVASAATGWLLDHSPRWGFGALLVAVAGVGFGVLRSQRDNPVAH